MTNQDQTTHSLSRIEVKSDVELTVVRRVYQQSSLNVDADYQLPKTSFIKSCKKFKQECSIRKFLLNSIPILKWLPKYNIKENFICDFIAGVTGGVLHIPHGIAYGIIAHSPPAVGLYMAVYPVLVYVIFGTSPHLSLGTFAVAMLMAGESVLDHADVPGKSVGLYTPEQVLSALSLTAGLVMLVMWCLRMGHFLSLLSDALVSGLTTGAAFHVGSAQFANLFGIKLPILPRNFKVINHVIEVSKRLPQTNLAVLIVSFVSCFCLAYYNERIKPWWGRHFRMPLPAELILIVVGTLMSNLLNLGPKYGVQAVGDIPSGLPRPSLPPIELMPSIFTDALTLTMVTYTVTMSMGLLFAAKSKYEIDANQELLAMGATDICGCFFGCAPTSAGLSRTYVQWAVGGKTLVISIVSACMIMLVLLWIGPFFETLPRSVLAAVVIVSLKGLYLQLFDIKKFWKLCKRDATVWLITFFVTTLIHIDFGLVAGLLTNVCSLLCRTLTPYTCLLGRVMDTELYVDIDNYRAARELPGIKIFHYCGGLNFVSKEIFRSRLFDKIDFKQRLKMRLKRNSSQENLSHVNSYVSESDFCEELNFVIIDASAVTTVDPISIKCLVNMNRALESIGITMVLAGANGPVLEAIERYNSIEQVRLYLLKFPRVHDAVTYHNANVATFKQPDTAVIIKKEEV